MTGSSFDVNFGAMTFDKWGTAGNTPYDLSSIMHYSTTSCARSRDQPVITKPDGSILTLTKGSSLSAHDITGINAVYNCGSAPPTTNKPTTGGTTKPTVKPTTPGPTSCCKSYKLT